MMAQPQLTLTPYSGTEKEHFREFEHLLRSILDVAAIPANQQANFLQLHLRDAALRYFQTLPLATRQNLELSIAALRNHFCNPQLQELHVLKLENLKFDSKTDNPENFLVTLQTKALKAYPDPNPPAVAPIDGAAPDAAVEQTRFDQDTARHAEIIRSAQEASSNQIRRQFIKNMPGWLHAKLLEQPENTTVDDLCIFARKQLSIHNLCKTDDSVMDAFSEMGPSVTDTLVNALTKLSTSQEAMDSRLNEMSKQMEERNTSFTNQLEAFTKTKTNSLREARIRKIVAKILTTEAIAVITEVATEEITEAIVDVQIIVETAVIITKILHHSISRLKISTIISQTLSLIRITIRRKLRMPIFRIKANKIRTLNSKRLLKYSLQTQTICHIRSSPRLRATNVVIQIIWHQIAL